MRSGLATRVDRIASRVAKRIAKFPTFICKQYDRADRDIVGLRIGVNRVPRQPGETVEQLLERALTETGWSMWAADYGGFDRWTGGDNPLGAHSANCDAAFGGGGIRSG